MASLFETCARVKPKLFVQQKYQMSLTGLWKGQLRDDICIMNCYDTLWRSWDRILMGGEIFRTRQDRSWGPPSLPYSGYRVFSGGKAARAWRWSPTSSSAEVKELVEPYLYSPSESSWPVLGWPLPLIYDKLWRLNGPPLWSSVQGIWLQIQRSRVRFPALPDFSEWQWVWNGVHSASWA